jgi:Flp pilus assembly protein TadB
VIFGHFLPAHMVQEVPWTEKVAERRRAHIVDHAGLEVEEHRAWYVLAARGLVVKHVDAVELRIVVAAVLAVAADAVLVVYFLLKFDANLAASLTHLHVHNIARRNSLVTGSIW